MRYSDWSQYYREYKEYRLYFQRLVNGKIDCFPVGYHDSGPLNQEKPDKLKIMMDRKEESP